MKKLVLLFIGISILFISCPEVKKEEKFISVSQIIDVATIAPVKSNMPLTGTVIPDNATNKKISWSIINQGDTQAVINNGILIVQDDGKFTVRATIRDGKKEGVSYTQDFVIEAIDAEADLFWSQDFVTNKAYQLTALNVRTGEYCKVWVEASANIPVETVEEIVTEFDEKIYNQLLSAFGKTNVTFNGRQFDDTMAFAYWMPDGKNDDEKLDILLLDIKDGWTPGSGYIAGYFWGGDLLTMPTSNRRAMIYIDTYPGIKDENGQITDKKMKTTFGTLAHEMQHLMNFATSFLVRSTTSVGVTTPRYMDTWINEGLSESAEWVYSQEQNENRISWFNVDRNGTIRRGNNFFVWGNREGSGAGQHRDAVLDDYATVYLFFQWLRIHGGGETIYSDIVHSNDTDYRAVVNEFKKTVTDATWDSMLKSWLAANYYNDPTGLHGYNEEIETLIINRIPGGSSIASLFPGEGVYSHVSNSYTVPSSSSGNIRYGGLGAEDFVSSLTANNALLTYNINLNRSAAAETGTITGIAPPPPTASVARSSGYSGHSDNTGSFAISAGDMLRRRGFDWENFDRSVIQGEADE
ncbi:MAG: hypothetical protein LBU66_00595 [Treponema sp.]|jgi:hypothetical protein|nr:hypothetical protein [Treponema sp.]